MTDMRYSSTYRPPTSSDLRLVPSTSKPCRRYRATARMFVVWTVSSTRTSPAERDQDSASESRAEPTPRPQCDRRTASARVVEWRRRLTGPPIALRKPTSPLSAAATKHRELLPALSRAMRLRSSCAESLNSSLRRRLGEARAKPPRRLRRLRERRRCKSCGLTFELRPRPVRAVAPAANGWAAAYG